ncbi:MAG: 50S ribosomal protein L1 [Candidatus Woesearchaeota archaeon]
MDKENFKKALELVKNNSPKRNFKQSVDFIVNLKGLDLKKPEQQVDIFVTLNQGKGKKIKICALVGPELGTQAKAVCDKVVLHDEFPRYTGNKIELKKLAKSYNFFIAQANLMADIAKTFGKVLGSRGKMPNPKAGCVVPPNANLKPLVEKLQKTIRISAKTQLSIKCAIGLEDTPDEQLLDNMTTIYNALTHALPEEENNIKNVMIKLSMGPPAVMTVKGNINFKGEVAKK